MNIKRTMGSKGAFEDRSPDEEPGSPTSWTSLFWLACIAVVAVTLGIAQRAITGWLW